MPAKELEQKVAHVLHRHLNTPYFTGNVVREGAASEIATAKAKLQLIRARKDVKPPLDLIDRIELRA